MVQAHLFIMDPLDSLRWEIDTSLGLARALALLGHQIWMAEPRHLSWQSAQQTVEVAAQPLVFEVGAVKPHTPSPPVLRRGTEFSAVHMRKDPPFDFSYIATTWLLDALVDQTRIFNAPSALRTINEKMGIFRFPEASHPAMVSADPELLYTYIATRCAGDGISKPLDSFGGRGVERINLAETSKSAALALLRKQTAQGRTMRMVQHFCPDVFHGEVRAFAVGGAPLAWCLKRPAAGSYLANTGAGAELFAYHPHAELQQRVATVAQELWHHHGVALVGFDIIADKISEINLTSPRLLQGKEDTTNYFTPMAQWVSEQCSLPLAPRTTGKHHR